MDYKYSKNSLIQGERYRREKQENPSTFATYNGEANPIDSDSLQQSNSRKAGQMAPRALELMQDPQAAQVTNEWMEMFGQSNQGAQFNQAKQSMANEAALNARLSN